MKVAVSKVVLRKSERWMVSYTPPGGSRLRRYFTNKCGAEAYAADLRQQHAKAGEVWLSLSAEERNAIAQLVADARAEGVDLRQALESHRANRSKTPASVHLSAAFERFMAEKSKSRLAHRTLTALKSNVGRFIQGRESLPLGEITRVEVMDWLNRAEWGPRTFNSYLTSVQTFFRWCAANEWIPRSPAATIPKVPARQMPDIDTPPAILTIAQCSALLRAVLAMDKPLAPYVAVCLFAGLRPEREAGRLDWGDIRNGRIEVRGLHAKDRQRRLVTVTPVLEKWLALGGDLPPKNLRRRLRRVRTAAGLNWVQDCLRHTFASNCMPIFGADVTREQLGHGDFDMLFRHYRELVSPEAAAVFWNLTPETVSVAD